MIDGIVEGIDGNTPVVESLAVLPISNDGSYTTEFLPEIRTRVGEHRDYKISVIMEDGMSVYSALTKGQNRPIHDVNEHETTSRWQADMVADLSEMEKMFLPDSSGHMILIATPVQEKPRLGYGGDFGLGSGFGNDFGYGGGMKGFGGGGMMRGGGSIGGVSISSGTNTGSASMFDGELESSSAGKPIIFHTRYLGFKADQVSRWGVPELDKLSDALGAYEIQQN